jgi:hypothetical protein
MTHIAFVRFPEALYEELRVFADERGDPVAALIRSGARRELAALREPDAA